MCVEISTRDQDGSHQSVQLFRNKCSYHHTLTLLDYPSFLTLTLTQAIMAFTLPPASASAHVSALGRLRQALSEGKKGAAAAAAAGGWCMQVGVTSV